MILTVVGFPPAQGQYVTLTGNIQAANGIPAADEIINFTPSQWFFVAGSGVIVNTTTNCATSVDGSVVGLPNPLDTTIVTSGFAGTLPPANYYVEYAWYVGSALTLPSPEMQVQQQMGGSITVQPPASGKPAGATGMVVYIAATSGAETKQGTTLGNASFVQNTPLATGVPPATINNTVCQQIANDAGWPTGTGYNVSLVDPSGNTIPGYPMMWQLLGPGSTINLSTGLPYYHGVVTFPSPILASPQNHATQSISGGLNLGGYPLTGVGSLNVTNSINSAYLPPTIAQAIANAGTAGSVYIPGNYGGTDYFTGNSHNIAIDDARPRNPLNNPTQTFPSVMPKAAVYGADYGMACDGNKDDTVAFQDALNALTNVIGIPQGAPQPMVQPAMQLPQGRCIVTAPVYSWNYGSVIGSPGGTTIAVGAWTGGNAAMLNIAENYGVANYFNQPQSTVNRVVRDISFVYNGNNQGSAITAVKVFNQTGQQNFPYPGGTGTNPQPFQLQGVRLEGITVYAMDTGIDMQDCGNCTIAYPNINAVRNGIVDDGNNYSLNIIGGIIQQGVYSFTPVGTGGRSGLYSISQARWSCTGGTGVNCAGGTIAQNVIVSPQTLGVYGLTVESFDVNDNIVNCLNLIETGNDFDSAIGNAAYFGQLKFAQIELNEFATSSQTQDAVQFAALTNAQSSGLLNQDGTWFDDNIVYSYLANSAFGVDFLTGTIARRNVFLERNQFTNLAIGIALNSPLTNSQIIGNYGATLTDELILFNATGAGSFSATFVDHNLEPDSGTPIPIYVDTAGGGYIMGFNQSVAQVTGTQTATATGCTISAGAVGNNCAVSGGAIVPIPYLDTNYTATCSVLGGNGLNTAVPATITNGGAIPVFETALTTGATGGGKIVCTTNHQ